MNFDPVAWVKHNFPHLAEAEAQKLIRALNKSLKQIELRVVQEQYGKLLKKALDSGISAGAVLPAPEDRDAFISAYLQAFRDAATEMGDTVSGYAPLQMEVTFEENLHGHDSDQASTARSQRRQYVEILLAGIAGPFKAAMK